METPSGQNQVGQELKQHTGRLVELGREILGLHSKDPDANPGAGRQEQVIIIANSKRMQDNDIFEQIITEDGTGHAVQIQYVKRTETPRQSLLEDRKPAVSRTDQSQSFEQPSLIEGGAVSRIDQLRFDLSDKMGKAAFGLVFQKPAETDDSAFELMEVKTRDDDLSRPNTFHLTGEAAPRQAHILEDSEIIAAMEAVTQQLIRILEQAVITPWNRAEVLGPLRELLRARRATLGGRFRAAIDALLRRIV